MPDWIDVTRRLQDSMVCWPGRGPIDVSWEKSVATGHHCNVSQWRANPHTGTHIDAPKHFFDDGATIDQAPLDTLVGSCCVVDHQDKILDGDAIDPYRGVQRLLLRSNHSGAAEDGVYPPHGPLLTEEAAAILVESGLLLVGTDRLSVDGSDSTDYTLHRLFLSASCFIMEGLDLSGVTPGDHELIALPLKVVGAEASPARVLVS